VPWTPGVRLRCPACGETSDPGPAWHGCAGCGGAPLEVEFGDPSGPRLPVPPAELTDLGLAPTPLVRAPESETTWLKLELRNPTGSHKDRFHAVTSAIARLARAHGVVTTSTGNHGVSCAAHAAADGLPCVVLSTAALPPALELEISAYGALVAKLDADERRSVLTELVERGWHPSTASDPALAGAGTPYGLEGYRAVADETVAQLGSMPSAVAVPAASGDTVVGVAKGFEALATGRGEEPPLILACQPIGAASLTASIVAGRQVFLEAPRSIARSTADEAIGRLAVAAVSRWGTALDVPDELIAQATRDLAGAGHYAETSSALALAGLTLARKRGLVEPDADAVALITSSGRGWSEDGAVFDRRAALTSRSELLAATDLLGTPRS
jgi:threonine synthase